MDGLFLMDFLNRLGYSLFCVRLGRVHTIQDLMRMSMQMEDKDLFQELEKQFAPFDVKMAEPNLQQLLK